MAPDQHLGILETVRWAPGRPRRELLARGGEGQLPVRYLLTHQAGLPALIGEVIRGVTGQSIGAYFRTELGGPAGILERPTRYGLGSQLTMPERRLAPGPRAFGSTRTCGG